MVYRFVFPTIICFCLTSVALGDNATCAKTLDVNITEACSAYIKQAKISMSSNAGVENSSKEDNKAIESVGKSTTSNQGGANAQTVQTQADQPASTPSNGPDQKSQVKRVWNTAEAITSFCSQVDRGVSRGLHYSAMLPYMKCPGVSPIPKQSGLICGFTISTDSVVSVEHVYVSTCSP